MAGREQPRLTRYGPLWARAALRPYAEQVVVALRLPRGAHVLDLGDDDGTTGGLLQRHGIAVSTAPAGGPTTGAVPGQTPYAALVAVRGGMDDSSLRIVVDAFVRGGTPTLVCTWAHAPHEQAVRRAFGLAPLVSEPGGAGRWPDVARFDTMDHLWAAAVARTDVAQRAASMSPSQLRAARSVLDAGLEEYLTADATLRIPTVMAVG